MMAASQTEQVFFDLPLASEVISSFVRKKILSRPKDISVDHLAKI